LNYFLKKKAFIFYLTFGQLDASIFSERALTLMSREAYGQKSEDDNSHLLWLGSGSSYQIAELFSNPISRARVHCGHNRSRICI
jgi:hypothetical protein